MAKLLSFEATRGKLFLATIGFATGLTRKVTPSACTKLSHCPRRSHDTPGEKISLTAQYM
jgi:hypothetical protein